jgi:hypothetical protein
MIPRIIHQTWKDKNPEKIYPKKWIDSWSLLNPEWKRMLWTDKDNREFMAKNYPEYLHIYDNYNMEIKRADIIRYFILHYYGGIYVDLDYECLKNIDVLLKTYETDLLFGIEPLDNQTCTHSGIGTNNEPIYITNSIMFSSQKNIFWNFVFDEMVSDFKSQKYYLTEAIIETGPKFLYRAFKKYEKKYSDYKIIQDPDVFIWTRERTKLPYIKLFNLKFKNVPGVKQDATYGIHYNTIIYLENQFSVLKQLDHKKKFTFTLMIFAKEESELKYLPLAIKSGKNLFKKHIICNFTNSNNLPIINANGNILLFKKMNINDLNQFKELYNLVDSNYIVIIKSQSLLHPSILTVVNDVDTKLFDGRNYCIIQKELFFKLGLKTLISCVYSGKKLAE